MKRRITFTAFVLLVVLVLLTAAGCETFYTLPQATAITIVRDTPVGEDLFQPGATATVAVLNATAQAALQQGTVGAAGEAVNQQQQLATQQAAQATARAQATLDAQATLVALERQATARAIATEQALAQLSAFALQLTAEANAVQATATHEAVRATATAQALNLQATATERAFQATETAQTLNREATATVLAIQIAQTATAEEAQEQEQFTRYGLIALFFVLAIGMVLALLLVVQRLTERPLFRLPYVSERTASRVIDHEPARVVRDRQARLEPPPLEVIDLQAESGEPLVTYPAPGLRSIHTLRRLEQAEKAGAIPPSLVDVLLADWEEVQR